MIPAGYLRRVREPQTEAQFEQTLLHQSLSFMSRRSQSSLSWKEFSRNQKMDSTERLERGQKLGQTKQKGRKSNASNS